MHTASKPEQTTDVSISSSAASSADLNAAINLRLALLGLPVVGESGHVTELVEPILARQRELSRRLADRLSPVDTRIQDFLNAYLADVGPAPSLPRRTLVLD